jgi:dinuclear metal center YbgI/SA1388 family protein
MVLRDNLNRFLDELYSFESFEDYCVNGLQVEGKEQIKKIVFGVSFNIHLVNLASKQNADAIIVHHGIFDKGFFVLKGHKKKKVKMLLDSDISLFGIHLPMDAHPQLGHNALLLSAINADSVEPFEIGFTGKNVKKHSIDQMVDIFHEKLHNNKEFEETEKEDSLFSLSRRKGFTIFQNGPEIPQKIAVISGGSSYLFEKAVEQGVDTFVCGEMKEHIPSLSHETNTNYINLGHYYSEKPGILALMKHIEENLEVETEYMEIPNPI